MAFDSQHSGRDDVGINDAALQAQIDALKTLVETGSSTTGLIGAPEPCTPNFVLAYEKQKNRLRAQVCVNCESGTSRIKVAICPTNGRADEATFQKNLLQDTYQLDETQSNAGHAEFKFMPPLEYNTSYDLVRLVSIGNTGERNALPSVDPVFNTTPIVQFTTPNAFGVPSDPAANLIITNTLDLTTVDYDTILVFRVWAPLTDGGLAQTWGASLADEVVVVIEDFGGGNAQHHVHKLTDAELTQVDAASTPVANRGYVDVVVKQVYKPGAHLQWTRNICWISGEKRQSTGAAVGFVAGNLGTDPTALTGLSLTIVTTGDYSPKFARVDLNFTQPATPVALKNYTLLRKLQGDPDGNYIQVLRRGRLQEDELIVAGAHTVQGDAEGIRFKPSLTYTMKCIIRAIGGATTFFTQDVTTGADTDGAATPGALATPTITTNTVDGDPDKNLARIVATIGPAAGTFSANNITQVNLVVRKRDSGGTPDTSDRQTIVKVLSDEELATSTCDIEFYCVIGQRYRIVKAVAINGDKRNQLGGLLVDFTAGNFIFDGTCPAPSFFSQPAADGNKIANFTIRLTNTNPPVRFKNLIVEVSYGGGTYRQIEGSPISLKNDDALNVASATKDFVITCKRKAGVTLDVRATARMVGGVSSTTTNATQLAASVPDRGQLLAAPSTTVTPTLTWKVHAERIRGRWDKPTGDIDALLGYYAVFTDNGGTNYMDHETGSSTTTEANVEQFVTDTRFASRVKKANIHSNFSGGVKLKVTPVWQVSGVATKGTANSSTLLSLGNEVISDALDAVRVIDVSSLMGAPQNVLQNGDCGFARAGSSTGLAAWRIWDKTSAINNTNTTAINTTSTDIHWDQSGHSIIWDGEGSAICQRVRSIVPGEYLSLTFMLKGTGTFTFPFPTLLIKLVKEGTTTDEVESATSIVTGGVVGAYAMRGCLFRLATSAAGNTPHWLVIQTAYNLTTSEYLHLDRLMMVRGKQPFAWVPNSAAEVSPFTGSEDYDVNAASITATDVGNATGGTQGGWFTSGNGGDFSV